MLPGVRGKAGGWKRRMNENCRGTLSCIYFIGNLHCLAEPYVKNEMGIVMLLAVWEYIASSSKEHCSQSVSCLLFVLHL